MVSLLQPPKIDTDLLVIGDGLIGLSTARALRQAGARVALLGRPEEGIASTAAAGLLIPKLDSLPENARPFFQDSLDRFPSFVESLREYDADLSLIHGVIERTPAGDILHERDGAIDNVRLVEALRTSLAFLWPRISIIRDQATEIEPMGARLRGKTRGGREFFANQVVLAAGAWSPQLRGLPRSLPVAPLKGQMIALGAAPLDRAMMGNGVYVVPRAGETIVGATVENAGFDTAVTDDAIESLRESAVSLVPELAKAPVTRSWAGIRPATPDMLPIICRDPDVEGLIYACGHAKNGVLLTPATAAAVVEIARYCPTPTPIDAFSITRFS